MIKDSIKLANVEKLIHIPYNFNLPEFSFSTESRSVQRWSERLQPRQPEQPGQPGSRPQLGATCNSAKVSIDPFNLPTVLLHQNKTFSAGCLKQNIATWRQITNDPDILKLISGVSLSFSSPPVQEKLPHEIQFSGHFATLVKNELQKFLDQGIIEHTVFKEGDFISNLFARPKKSPGEIRLILNLKPLNAFVPSVHFKMESLEVALKMLRPNMYLASIDLTNSFYHLSVKPSDRKFLKFSCLGNQYRFTSLVMGYKESPTIFTKVMKVPLAFLREHYHCLLVCYIDDLLILGHSISEVKKSRLRSKSSPSPGFPYQHGKK